MLSQHRLERRALLRERAKPDAGNKDVKRRRWQWCQRNPDERVSREAKNERDEWLTLEEEKKLLECCVLHPTRKDNIVDVSLRLQEIELFALNTGMRQDEVTFKLIIKLHMSKMKCFSVTLCRS